MYVDIHTHTHTLIKHNNATIITMTFVGAFNENTTNYIYTYNEKEERETDRQNNNIIINSSSNNNNNTIVSRSSH